MPFINLKCYLLCSSLKWFVWLVGQTDEHLHDYKQDHPSIHLSNVPSFCICRYMSISLSNPHLSVHLAIHLSARLVVSPCFIHFFYPSIIPTMFISVSVSTSNQPTNYLSTQQPISQSPSLRVRQSIHSINQTYINRAIEWTISPSTSSLDFFSLFSHPANHPIHPNFASIYLSVLFLKSYSPHICHCDNILF